jgi:O-antigen/teichoic acid export membrane protein
MSQNDAFTNGLIFIIAGSIVFQSFNVINFYFQASVLSKYFVYANLASLLITSVLRVVMILMNAPLIAFVTVVLIEAVVIAFGLVYFYGKLGFKLRLWRYDRGTGHMLLKESWPMILSGVAISLYMKIDQVMITNALGSEQTGYYAAAVRLSEIWLFIAGAITSSLAPAIVHAKGISQTLYLDRIQQLYRLLVFIALGISVVIYVLAEPITRYSYGMAFEPTVMLLQLYVWSIPFVFLNNGAWQWHLNEHLQLYAMIRLMIGAMVNIGLNILWIREYGTVGAVYATLVSYAVASYFGNLISAKTLVNFKMQTVAFVTFYKLGGVK